MVAKKKYAPTSIEIGGITFKIIYKELEDFGQMEFDKKITACPSCHSEDLMDLAGGFGHGNCCQTLKDENVQ